VLLQSLLPAWRHRRLFRQVRTYALFIGHGRSGSSLVGSLINAHRHALIAHELNALHFVKRRFPRLAFYWLHHFQDQAFDRAGREWTGYDYRVAGQWQGRFDRLLVIGDKHAGGATRVLGQRPEILARLRRTVGVSVKMVHIVRNPLDNIATLHRRQDLSLPDAARHYWEHAATNERLLRDNPCDALTLHLEDVIADPGLELSRLCRFLDLDAPSDYLEACAAALFAAPRRTRDLIDWPPELLADTLRQSRRLSFLEPYGEDIACFAERFRSPRTPLRRAA
jgi:hypothetical protein